MNTTRPRAYTIDAAPPTVCHPITFTDLVNLPAAHGTVIVMDDMEHMRVPEGWIDSMGNWCTNEEMRELLIKNPHTSRVVYNIHRTSY
nr:MAG TPA: hypothetical protein [Caudoviricetes sp.]